MAGLVPTRSSNADIRDYTWLASRENVENAQSGTLHAASLAAAGTHKLDNWIKSGTPLGEITAEGATKGQFGLYDPAATDGRQKHIGFLLVEIQLTDPVSGVQNSPLSGAIHRRGQVIVNRLPVAFDPTDADVSPHFIYR